VVLGFRGRVVLRWRLQGGLFVVEYAHSGVTAGTDEGGVEKGSEVVCIYAQHNAE